MRIVSWNCCWQKGGFTEEKRNEILRLNPDILIVQECKQDDWLKLGFSDKNGHWYGDGKESQGNPDKNLGIGIYCDKKYSIDCSLFKGQNLSNMRYALPYIIKYQDEDILTIFSVWAKSGYKNYHVPILNSLESFFNKTNTIVAVVGDFNTGSQYNNKENKQNYEFIKNELKKKYFLENCDLSQEWIPTFHVKKNENYEFYLDDHCFIETIETRQIVLSFCLGEWTQWSKFSDHVPLIIDLNDNVIRQASIVKSVIYNSKELKEAVKDFNDRNFKILKNKKCIS
jgi:exonuclease III